jgi:hypothetical protein
MEIQGLVGASCFWCWVWQHPEDMADRLRVLCGRLVVLDAFFGRLGCDGSGSGPSLAWLLAVCRACPGVG